MIPSCSFSLIDTPCPELTASIFPSDLTTIPSPTFPPRVMVCLVYELDLPSTPRPTTTPLFSPVPITIPSPSVPPTCTPFLSILFPRTLPPTISSSFPPSVIPCPELTTSLLPSD